MTTDTMHQWGRGALFITASSLLFSIMGILIKLVSVDLPNEMLVFSRNAMALVLVAPFMFREPSSLLSTKCLHIHLIRATFGLLAMYCFFYSLSLMPLAEATTFYFTFPLFSPLVARIWLKEPLAPGSIWGLSLGFLGVILISKPENLLQGRASLIGISSGLFTAVAQGSIRRLAREESTIRIVFFFCLIATTASAGPILPTWQTPQSGLWLALLSIGILAVAGQTLLAKAYTIAPVSFLAPFVYLSIGVSVFFDWYLWGQLPDFMTFSGMICIIAAGVWMLRQKNKKQ